MESRDSEEPIKSVFTVDEEPLRESQRNADSFERTISAYRKDVDTNINNNNHHVVPVGVLIVLVTVYLGMNGVQRCFVMCFENQVDKDLLVKAVSEAQSLHYSSYLKGSDILERLLEYRDICKDLEVFTKEINIHNYTRDKDDKLNDDDSEEKTPIYSSIIDSDGSSGGGSGSGNGNEACSKPLSKTYKKAKHHLKVPTNNKTGFNKHNKAKYAKMDKKDINDIKKTSTAEPIIYLFALVFIYLLLKAASDINQHYKSKTKNDKRLRRCSLQSYAQIHRPDRRASKASEMVLKQKHQRPMVNRRMSAVNPTSLPTPTQLSLRIRSQSPNNWQLLRQHLTTSVDNSDISKSHVLKPDGAIKNRRCSVPIALNYQPKIAPLSLPVGLHSNDPLYKRRTSISMPLDPIDGLATIEIKRRVRMINRH